MTVSTGFLIYAALYRLTVLAVGALSIWLGFRLFNKAGSKAYDSTGSASAEGSGFKLTLTSILPGTYFALFGTVIISTMLWKGEPQLDQKNATETTDKGEVRSASILTRDSEASLDGKADADRAWDKLNPNITLKEAAVPLSTIAKSWQQEGKRIGEAVALANLAVQYGKDEDKVKYLDLLAELLRANGNEEKAAEAEQAAAALRRQGQ
ncbi:hypothetical protein VU04_10450 [Desulfobulbus sp. TB]|nr:hypothetical protein [Desulfobulbus sp. TB]